MSTAPRLFVLLLLVCAVASAQSIQFPYRGLDYSMVSKEGLTVMVAPMKLSLLNYSAAHVWVTNGSKAVIRLDPRFFVARARGLKQVEPGDFVAISDSTVVADVMQRASMNDVLVLVRAYEQNLYGFKNDSAINYYQARKQIAAAEGSGRRFRAGAMVSAIILPKTDVPPGEFREGTIFFVMPDKKPEFLGFVARIAELQFTFGPLPDEK